MKKQFFESVGFFDVLDQVMASTIGVPVEEYIEKIESIDEEQASSIMFRLLSDDDATINEGIRMFNDI